MDGSITRSGRTCWYKLPDIQMSGINDGLLVESAIFQILKEHFSHLDCYTNLMEYFHEYFLISALGQYLDNKAMRENVLSLTMEKYKSIVAHKANYCYYMPITAAFHLAGYTNPEIFNHAKAILFELGYFTQVQNDFYDCFGDPNHLGKIGTDIQEGKSTWLIAKCLEKATDVQKEVLEECYGKNDPECIRRVKQIYEQLSIPDLYATFEKDTYNNIMMLIEKTSGIPAEVYLETVRELFTRGK
uniref:Uncharacterized protein n=1 Tax=Phlebotomus papatasi TaxID=29031 RepID=A0A1B0D8M0_PHLPP